MLYPAELRGRRRQDIPIGGGDATGGQRAAANQRRCIAARRSRGRALRIAATVLARRRSGNSISAGATGRPARNTERGTTLAKRRLWYSPFRMPAGSWPFAPGSIAAAAGTAPALIRRIRSGSAV